ncbi:pyridoxal-phosphate dependent enzyme [Jiangella asiatica]|uniref:pyridoxal-phosphate dependent enzyme n=1 Tax=Jiangella asiatica TaxID=2530372 RepID=UPI0013A5C49F|nr:pyridoxal-phosphate dependent enzyme [Jiangella asiatica]
MDTLETGPWRYAAALPRVPAAGRVRLGEARTPLVPVRIDGADALLKAEYALPTGSYKDRGSAVVVSLLHHVGVTEVMDDSSGNAGASLAAYAAAAGMRCVVYVPASNSSGKLAQIRGYGAELRPIGGDRAAAMRDAAAADGAPFYASHNRMPAFIAGVSTLGFELWEDLGHAAPAVVVVPAGHGSLVLALAHAFRALRSGGSIDRLPRLIAVQAQTRSALSAAWSSGRDEVTALDHGPTIAEGVAAVRPLYGGQLLRAIRESHGDVLTVTEHEIAAALRDLGRLGHYVEPTSAVAVAGFRRLAGSNTATNDTVVVLTGSGLKSAWPDAEMGEMFSG